MGKREANHHIFVDESGDAVLFNASGDVLVEQSDAPLVFMVGAVHLPDPIAAHQKLETLRQNLLSDPYFRSAESMRPECGKTAITFHAKDDLPEVRREVFKLLPELGGTVQVAIRRKRDMADEAGKLFTESGQKLRLEAYYDDLVERALKELIPPACNPQIVFAKLGKSDRKEALRSVIHRVVRFAEDIDDPMYIDRVQIDAAFPKDAAGLQVADYYLWAIQRMFRKARGERRYYESVSTAYRMIWDIDDRRNKDDGEVYDANNPFSLEKIKPVAG
jgi:hypothetical protein